MNIPHDIRWLSHPFFVRALNKFGFFNQIVKTNQAAAKLQLILNRIVLGNKTKKDEDDLLEAIAETEIYLSALVNDMGLQDRAKEVIQLKLESEMNEVLKE